MYIPTLVLLALGFVCGIWTFLLFSDRQKLKTDLAKILPQHYKESWKYKNAVHDIEFKVKETTQTLMFAGILTLASFTLATLTSFSL